MRTTRVQSFALMPLSLIVFISVAPVSAMYEWIPPGVVCDSVHDYTPEPFNGVPPPMPELPNQYTMNVQANILQKAWSSDVVEHYDGPNNKAAVFLTFNGTTTQTIFNYQTMETYDIYPDGTCKARGGKADYLGFFRMDRNHRPVKSTVYEMFHMGPKQNFTYVGNTWVRGIRVNHWTSCQEWPDWGAKFQLDYYFSHADYQTAWGMGQIPIRAVVNGSAGNEDENQKPMFGRHKFEHIYDFTAFNVGPIKDQTVFNLPHDVVCTGRKDFKSLPVIPDNFQMDMEMNCPMMGGGSMPFQHSLRYDWEHSLVETYMNIPSPQGSIDEMKRQMMDHAMNGGSSADMSKPINMDKMVMRAMSTIDDHHTGLRYITEKFNNTCRVSAMPEEKDAMPMDHGKSLFDMHNGQKSGNSPFTYQGRSIFRNMPVDVWGIDADGAIQKVFFLADNREPIVMKNDDAMDHPWSGKSNGDFHNNDRPKRSIPIPTEQSNNDNQDQRPTGRPDGPMAKGRPTRRHHNHDGTATTPNPKDDNPEQSGPGRQPTGPQSQSGGRQTGSSGGQPNRPTNMASRIPGPPGPDPTGRGPNRPQSGPGGQEAGPQSGSGGRQTGLSGGRPNRPTNMPNRPQSGPGGQEAGPQSGSGGRQTGSSGGRPNRPTNMPNRPQSGPGGQQAGPPGGQTNNPLSGLPGNPQNGRPVGPPTGPGANMMEQARERARERAQAAGPTNLPAHKSMMEAKERAKENSKPVPPAKARMEAAKEKAKGNRPNGPTGMPDHIVAAKERAKEKFKANNPTNNQGPGGETSNAWMDIMQAAKDKARPTNMPAPKDKNGNDIELTPEMLEKFKKFREEKKKENEMKNNHHGNHLLSKAPSSGVGNNMPMAQQRPPFPMLVGMVFRNRTAISTRNMPTFFQEVMQPQLIEWKEKMAQDYLAEAKSHQTEGSRVLDQRAMMEQMHAKMMRHVGEMDMNVFHFQPLHTDETMFQVSQCFQPEQTSRVMLHVDTPYHKDVLKNKAAFSIAMRKGIAEAMGMSYIHISDLKPEPHVDHENNIDATYVSFSLLGSPPVKAPKSKPPSISEAKEKLVQAIKNGISFKVNYPTYTKSFLVDKKHYALDRESFQLPPAAADGGVAQGKQPSKESDSSSYSAASVGGIAIATLLLGFVMAVAVVVLVRKRRHPEEPVIPYKITKK